MPVQLTHDNLRGITKNLRALAGGDVNHTKVLDAVASALGFRTDALMHSLKTEARQQLHPTSARPARDEGATLRLTLAHLSEGDVDGARSVLTGQRLTSPLGEFVSAVSLHASTGDTPAVRDRIGFALRSDGGAVILRLLDLPERAARVAAADDGTANLRHLLDWAFLPASRNTVRYVLSVASEAGLVKPRIPAVPVEQSVTDDAIICLFTGREQLMLARHLKARFDMTPEEYCDYWNLPADYPMVAPSFERDKVSIQTGGPRPHLKNLFEGKRPPRRAGDTPSAE